MNAAFYPLLFAAVVSGALGAMMVGAGIGALARARTLGFAWRVLAGMLLVSLAGLFGTIAVGVHGYRALTRENLAARIVVQPTGVQRFNARFIFPDGREAVFELAGDEIHVDAHILKWKPLANLLGLHTAYELGRVAGRYHRLEHERSATRTVHLLARNNPVDLFGLRRHYAFLAPLLDAEYGSATFVPVDESAEFELRVSPTGLLIRAAGPSRAESARR